jgi:ribosomal protein L9
VGPAEVVAALKREGITLDAGAVQLAEPVKQVGVFDLPVKLADEAVAHLRLWVVEQKGGR